MSEFYKIKIGQNDGGEGFGYNWCLVEGKVDLLFPLLNQLYGRYLSCFLVFQKIGSKILVNLLYIYIYINFKN